MGVFLSLRDMKNKKEMKRNKRIVKVAGKREADVEKKTGESALRKQSCDEEAFKRWKTLHSGSKVTVYEYGAFI